MSLGTAVVPAGAGALGGAGGGPISLPCWLGTNGRGGQVAGEAGPGGPCPPSHLPSSSSGFARTRRQPGVAGGEGSERSQGEAGRWPPPPAPAQPSGSSPPLVLTTGPPPPGSPSHLASPHPWALLGVAAGVSTLPLTLGTPWFASDTRGSGAHLWVPGPEGPGSLGMGGVCWGHGGWAGGELGVAARGSSPGQVGAEGTFPVWRRRSRWGPAGGGCGWERPERSWQTEQSCLPASPRFPARGREGGPCSAHLPGARGGWLFPPTAGPRGSTTLGPQAHVQSLAQPLLASQPPGSIGSRSHGSCKPGASPVSRARPPFPEIIRRPSRLPSLCSPAHAGAEHGEGEEGAPP